MPVETLWEAPDGLAKVIRAEDGGLEAHGVAIGPDGKRVRVVQRMPPQRPSAREEWQRHGFPSKREYDRAMAYGRSRNDARAPKPQPTENSIRVQREYEQRLAAYDAMGKTPASVPETKPDSHGPGAVDGMADRACERALEAIQRSGLG